MDGFEKSLIISGVFDTDSLIATRNWQPLSEGVFISSIYETGSDSARAAFLHYLPGSKVPVHKHTGFEHILILQGSQLDGDTVYDAGTLVIHKPETDHDILSPQGCIALGIWEKPVSFSL